MLHAGPKKAAAINDDVPGALDEVAAAYKIGQEGGPKNLEDAIVQFQKGMPDYKGNADGQWGQATESARGDIIKARRVDPTSADAVTDPIARQVMRLDEPLPAVKAVAPQTTRLPAAPAVVVPADQAPPAPAAVEPAQTPLGPTLKLKPLRAVTNG